MGRLGLEEVEESEIGVVRCDSGGGGMPVTM